MPDHSLEVRICDCSLDCTACSRIQVTVEYMYRLSMIIDI